MPKTGGLFPFLLQLGNKTGQKSRFFNSLLIENRPDPHYFNTMQPLADIQQTIHENRLLSPLRAASVAILAASKGQDAEAIESLIAQGLVDFGENRVQEAAAKWPDIKKRHPHVRLHLIGPLQTNKAAEALALFDVIQTLDRPKLAEAIATQLQMKKELGNGGIEEMRKINSSIPPFPNSPIPLFYIQVNTGEEPQKSGIAPSEAAGFIAYCKNLGLNIAGLMCVPPAGDMPAPHFALLRKLAMENDVRELSMGMSGDYETAVRMGSTCVRLGTLLFGARAIT